MSSQEIVNRDEGALRCRSASREESSGVAVAVFSVEANVNGTGWSRVSISTL